MFVLLKFYRSRPLSTENSYWTEKENEEGVEKREGRVTGARERQGGGWQRKGERDGSINVDRTFQLYINDP